MSVCLCCVIRYVGVCVCCVIRYNGKMPASVEVTVRSRVFAPHKRGLQYIVVQGFIIEKAADPGPNPDPDPNPDPNSDPDPDPDPKPDTDLTLTLTL